MKFFLSILMTLSFLLHGYLRSGFASSSCTDLAADALSLDKQTPRSSPQLSRQKAATVPAKKAASSKRRTSTLIVEDPLSCLLGSLSKPGKGAETPHAIDFPLEISHDDLMDLIKGKKRVVLLGQRVRLNKESKDLVEERADELDLNGIVAILDQSKRFEPSERLGKVHTSTKNTKKAVYGLYENTDLEKSKYLGIVLIMTFSKRKSQEVKG